MGEVSVDVSMASDEGAAGVTLRFEVHDTGIGISEADQQRLFLPFSQADESTTRRFGGTGLGLATCKRIVELFGGEITAQSRLGRGSTFSFTARLERDAAAGEEESRMGPALGLDAEDEAALTGLRVLVVSERC
jgi:two-component system sensor histidine kinase/response regulator